MKKHKFKVGDVVKIVNYGYGLPNNSDVGSICTITELKQNYMDNMPGYAIDKPIGNMVISDSDFYYQLIGEASFKLVKSSNIKPNKNKQITKEDIITLLVNGMHEYIKPGTVDEGPKDIAQRVLDEFLQNKQ